jgi:hypothetical protein
VFVNLEEGARQGLVCEWQYAGRQDLGQHPQFSLSFDSLAGQVEEKMALWNGILESCETILPSQQ